MSGELTENLADEAQLALAYIGPNLRDALRIFLELDGRLARIVSATTEPMLGQMRLAWWRDALGMAVSERPQGDAVLDGIGTYWGGAEASLVALVDGWEHMLSEPPLDATAARDFVSGRAEGLSGLAILSGSNALVAEKIRAVGRFWALADAASHIAEEAERQTLLDLAPELGARDQLSTPFRGVAVLGALGERSIRAAGAPLMAGRGAALVALRAGLLGR